MRQGHMLDPIFILNGPNLNALGMREPHIYGTQTLDDIENLCNQRTGQLGLACVFRQTNHEGELVDWIQETMDGASGLILNAGAYTHTSVAIRDALALTNVPVIELHLSNIFEREDFRHHSFISAQAQGVICGFGAMGYELAIDALARLVAGNKHAHSEH